MPHIQTVVKQRSLRDSLSRRLTPGLGLIHFVILSRKRVIVFAVYKSELWYLRAKTQCSACLHSNLPYRQNQVSPNGNWYFGNAKVQNHLRIRNNFR